jgi:perosamine synthetase
MRDSIISIDSALSSILVAINATPAGIAFLVNQQEQLCGVITDGDLRRLLMKGRKLSDPLIPSDYGECIYAEAGTSIQDLLAKTSKKVRIIPIVDSQRRIVDYFIYEHNTHFTPVSAPDLQGNELKYVTDAILSTWISSIGTYVTKFEQDFSAYSDCKYGVAVANGTVALHLALAALGIGAGDEVIIPDLTFAATANAVIYTGAKPVIVDVEKDSWCIDPLEIEKAITPKTKAIIAVHLYGQPCNMEAILDLAKKKKLFVIEDAAEAHGAEYRGQKVGSFGDIGCFSFYANKIITTGEGGMCVTSDPALEEKMRLLRDHGMNKSKRYWHDEVGFNYRMTNIQAAIGCAQFERINDTLRTRHETEVKYQELLSRLNCFEWQNNFSDRKRVVWLVSAIFTKDRSSFIKKMLERTFDIRPFFYSLSEMPPYREFAFSNQVSQRLSRIGVNLPTLNNIDFEKFQRAVESALL